jgi:uncharacterized protein (DUF433 family)
MATDGLVSPLADACGERYNQALQENDMPQHETKPRSWIEQTPGVCGGEPCIRRTRHTVVGLVQWRKLGLDDDEILRQHPDLTQDDLDAAWRYYEEHSAEVDAQGGADDEL